MEETRDSEGGDGSPPHQADPAMDRLRRARRAHVRLLHERRRDQELWEREREAAIRAALAARPLREEEHRGDQADAAG